MIIVFPNKVKLLRGMVNNPVTHVADVAVKKRSISAIGCMCEIGNDNSNVPIMISKKNEKRIIRDGDMSTVIYLVI